MEKNVGMKNMCSPYGRINRRKICVFIRIFIPVFELVRWASLKLINVNLNILFLILVKEILVYIYLVNFLLIDPSTLNVVVLLL